jgi:hypothetical protein
MFMLFWAGAQFSFGYEASSLLHKIDVLTVFYSFLACMIQKHGPHRSLKWTVNQRNQQCCISDLPTHDQTMEIELSE